MVIKVEMGEGAVSEAPNIITSIGCGSCVVVVLYDARLKVGGLAHVMLPNQVRNEAHPHPNPPLEREGMKTYHLPQGEGQGEGGVCSEIQTPHSAFQFASTAIPALLEEMRKRGCSRRNITAKIAGGAKMFSSYAEFPAGIGEQNVKSIRQLLGIEGIPLRGFDVGGKHGRSVEFYLDSGRVAVKAFGREDMEI